MYKYYADVAPAAAKFLRVFLLLPGGDKKVGLEQMLRARARGRLLQGEADYQLHIIYLWYERQTARALHILEGLRQHYPGNPLFLSEIARIQDDYLHDPTASLDSWRALLAASRDQRMNAPMLAEVRARLAIARILDRLHQTDSAIEQLQAVIALKPQSPYGSVSLAYLRLGEAFDRLGDRAAALQAYRDAGEAAPDPDVHSIQSSVKSRTRRTPDARHTESYRLSLEGWRSFEKSDLDEAESMLERSLEINGADPVTHYRLGRVLQSQKEDALALSHLESAIRGARTCPAPILGTAYLEAARLHERSGRKEEAISFYRVVASLFGAAADTRSAATRALTRLRASESR
jgi:tetratricopeptide (TPR) repeat protein